MALENDPFDWDWLAEQMRGCPWSPEAREAGVWAIETLEEQLGPGWPRAWRDPGQPPPEIAGCCWSLFGFASTLSLALALAELEAVAGMAALRKMIRTNSRPDLSASPRLQLRVASLARAGGFEVGLEPLLPDAETRADLSISDGRVSVGVEALAILRDEKTMDASDWLGTVTPYLRRIAEDHAVDFRGVVEAPLGESETTALLEEIGRQAPSAARGLALPPVRVGGVTVELVPSECNPGTTNFQLPTISFGARMQGKLEKKIEQTRRSGADWLLIDSLDHLWHMTEWGDRPLAEKGRELAGFLRGVLGGADHLLGAVISDGAGLMRPEVGEETVELGEGAVALRRRADQWQIRESVIVALGGEGLEGAQVWRAVLEAESGWLEAALAGVGLPVPKELAI